ncbi:MAG: cysteine--tRNA ligase [Steroidobacteraceae bacterium]
MIRIHNSLTGEKQPLEPITPGEVRMYVCGLTVYDFMHIGHARMMIVFDVVKRYLRHSGYRVMHVRNITDIDDRIISRAAQNGESIGALSERFITAMNEDCDALAVIRPDFEPRATEYLPAIIAMVEKLIAGGYAYLAPNGDVMYAVAKFAGYGRLSGKRLADLRAGARVEIDEAKRDPLDFVLWKHAKPGEPAWDSPWGQGRPGWHIECSAMSVALLGSHFDIHGGGLDLKFPHHENEIAQTCAATGDRFAEIWMHNGFVNIDNEKMSKSLGNFFTVREVLEKAVRHPEVLRYFLLSSHYRGPINYSLEQLEQADAALGRIMTALRDLPEPAQGAAPATGYAARFQESMDDDFNTPEAIAVLQTLTREINSAKDGRDGARAAALGAQLRSLAGLLGITVTPREWFSLGTKLVSQGGAKAAAGAILTDAEIAERIQARIGARKTRNWTQADRIRDELAGSGVILEDKPDGSTEWRRA